MLGSKHSLNVATAGGVVLFELLRKYQALARRGTRSVVDRYTQGTLVTANARLSRQLRRDYDSERRRQGLRVWEIAGHPSARRLARARSGRSARIAIRSTPRFC